MQRVSAAGPTALAQMRVQSTLSKFPPSGAFEAQSDYLL